jgi:hypothetical protein
LFWIQLALLKEDASDNRRQRFRDRHENVWRIRRHSVVVMFKNDFAPVKDDQTVGVTSVQELIDAVLPAAVLEAKRRKILRLGHQLPNIAWCVGNIC